MTGMFKKDFDISEFAIFTLRSCTQGSKLYSRTTRPVADNRPIANNSGMVISARKYRTTQPVADNSARSGQLEAAGPIHPDTQHFLLCFVLMVDEILRFYVNILVTLMVKVKCFFD